MEPRILRPMHYESSAWVFYFIGIAYEVKKQRLQLAVRFAQSVFLIFRKGENMKEKWKEWTKTLSDSQIMSKREFLLTIAVCVLGGIVFGMLCSPKKSIVIGSNNGNNSGNCAQDDNADEDCLEETEIVGVWEDNEQ